MGSLVGNILACSSSSSSTLLVPSIYRLLLGIEALRYECDTPADHAD
jgi:hypothetical protein